MAELDKLLAKMVQTGAERAVLQSDQPLYIEVAQEKKQGPLLSMAQLFEIIREVTPEVLYYKLTQSGQLKFVYQSVHGAFEIEVVRDKESICAVLCSKQLQQSDSQPLYSEHSQHWQQSSLSPQWTKQSSPSATNLAQSSRVINSSAFSAPVFFDVDASIVSQIISNGENVLVGCKYKQETEYLIIGIPLWFNIVTQYLLFTDQRILLATRTLWRGINEIVPIPYSEIYSIVITVKEKKLMHLTEKDARSQIIVRLINGELIDLSTREHDFAAVVANRAKNFVKISREL